MNTVSPLESNLVDNMPSPAQSDPASSSSDEFPPLGPAQSSPQDQWQSHCLLHCKHTVCQRTIKIDKAKEIQRVCYCHLNPHKQRIPPNVLSVLRNKVESMTLHDFARPHTSSPKIGWQMEITMTYGIAIRLIDKAESLGGFDIHKVLMHRSSKIVEIIKDPDGKEEEKKTLDKVVDEASDYVTDSLKKYFQTSLSRLPNQKRTMTLIEMYKEIKVCVEWDIMPWLAENAEGAESLNKRGASRGMLADWTEIRDENLRFIKEVHWCCWEMAKVMDWWSTRDQNKNKKRCGQEIGGNENKRRRR